MEGKIVLINYFHHFEWKYIVKVFPEVPYC